MKTLVIGTMTLLVVASAPAVVSAQETDADVQRTADAADREDRGEWGWLGLLGLGGLLGLKRRDHDYVSNRDRASTAR